MDQDPFETSLRELLQEPNARQQSAKVLERVLRTANRQTGAGALLALFGRALESVLIGLESASTHWRPVSRLARKNTVTDKAH